MTTRTVNMRPAIASAAVMAVLVGITLAAHHSFAMYDQKKVVTLTGVIRQFVPQANHAAIHFILFAPDHKSALQERLQALGLALPDYRVSGEAGPDHRKTFHVDVIVAGETLASAQGKAKKEAEQEAARLALEKLAIR